MLILSRTKRPDNKAIMDIEDLLKLERAKVAALEKELKERDELLEQACSALLKSSMERFDGQLVNALNNSPKALRDWFGAYRAKQKRESEQKTSGEAGRV